MSPELSFIGTLINRQMLDVISDSITLEEHVLSHRRQYGHDEGRYPEYFNEAVLARVTFFPTKFKEQDTTEHLSRILKTTFGSQGAILDLPFSVRVRQLFLGIRDRLLDVLQASEGLGITMSLFRDVLRDDEPASLQEIGRLLSYYHIKHYLDYCQADICTSVPGGIASLDIAARFPPLFDWSIFRMVCNGLYGYDALRLPPALYDFAAVVSGSPIHRRLVDIIQKLILGAIYVAVSEGADTVQQIVAKARVFVDDCFDHASQTGLANVAQAQVPDLNLWLNRASHALFKAEGNGRYKEFVEMAQVSNSQRVGRVLVLTANDTEIRVSLEEFATRFGRRPQREFVGTTTIYLLGQIGRSDVVLAQGAMSDEGPDAISMKTVELIDRLNPDYVILSGICLGLEKSKQRFGDIILSRDVRNYNLQKVTEENGKLTVILRGGRVPASPTLMDRFRSGKVDWKECRVDPGLMMSGSVLVNHPDFVAALKRMEPEALGAEMEGAGLFAACMRKKVDWILVKSISDWGFKKDDSAHELAARNSIRFVYEVINAGGLFVSR